MDMGIGRRNRKERWNRNRSACAKIDKSWGHSSLQCDVIDIIHDQLETDSKSIKTI